MKAIVQYSGSLKEKLPNLYSVSVWYKDLSELACRPKLPKEIPLLFVFEQWEEFMGLGLEVSDQELDEVISSQKANQCCALIYTSGTTGSPKGVMLSHDNVSYYRKCQYSSNVLLQINDNFKLWTLIDHMDSPPCKQDWRYAASWNQARVSGQLPSSQPYCCPDIWSLDRDPVGGASYLCSARCSKGKCLRT